MSGYRQKSYQTSTYISRPNKNIDSSSKAFALVKDRDIDKLKIFLSEYNSTLSFINDEGNTLLHVLLNTTDDKDIIKIRQLTSFLLDHGVPVSTPNKANITALHLAAKLSDQEIIDMLIKHGASVNAIDNNDMTPLHYAVQGTVILCGSELIRKSIVKHKNEHTVNDFSKLTDDMEKNIRQLLEAEPFKVYVNHIKNTIAHEMKSFSAGEFEQVVIDAQTRLTATQSSDLKTGINKTTMDNLLKLIARDAVTDVSDICNKILSSTINPLTIKPNQESGWGPNENEAINKILPGNPEKDLAKVELEHDHFVRNALSKLSTENIQVFYDKAYEMKQKITSITNKFQFISALNYLLYTLNENAHHQGRIAHIDEFDHRLLVNTELPEFVDIDYEYDMANSFVAVPDVMGRIIWNPATYDDFNTTFDIIKDGNVPNMKSYRLGQNEVERKKEMRGRNVEQLRELNIGYYPLYIVSYDAATGFHEHESYKLSDQGSNEEISFRNAVTEAGKIRNDLQRRDGAVYQYSFIKITATYDGWANNHYHYTTDHDYNYGNPETDLITEIKRAMRQLKNTLIATGHPQYDYRLDLEETFHINIVNEIPTDIERPEWDRIIHHDRVVRAMDGTITSIQKILPTTKLQFYITRTMQHSTTLMQNIGTIQQMLTHNTGNNIYAAYVPLVTECIISILNIMENIKMAIKEKDTVTTLLQNIMLSDIREMYEHHETRGHRSVYIYLTMGGYITEMTADIEDMLTNKIEIIYGSIVQLSGNLNTIIDIINNNSAMKYMREYMNNNFAGNEISPGQYVYQTRDMNQMYKYMLPKMNILPPTFKEYIQISGNREDIIKEFIPTINNNQYSIYLIRDGAIPTFTPEIHFTDWEKETYQIIPPDLTTRRNPRIGYLWPTRIGGVVRNQGTERQVPSDITIPHGRDATDNMQHIIDNAVDMDVNHMEPGHLGHDIGTAIMKEYQALPVLGEKLDVHFSIIKQYIIQNVIMTYYAVRNNDDHIQFTLGADSIFDRLRDVYPDFQQVIQHILTEFLAKYDIPIAFDISAIIYSFVAKLTDRILISMIKDQIVKFSIEFISDKIKIQEPQEDKFDKARRFGLDDFVISVDKGLKFDMNEIIIHLVRGYYDVGAGYVSDISRDTTLLAMDSDIKSRLGIKEYHKLYNTNYTHSTPISQSQCHKVHTGSITTLLTNGADSNRQDKLGNTALFYAIELQRPDIVSLMLHNGSDKLLKFANGKNGKEYAFELLKHHADYVLNTQVTCTFFYDEFSKTSADTLLNKDEYGNNILSSLDVIFPQTLKMFNELIYRQAHTYNSRISANNITQIKEMLQRHGVAVYDDKTPLFAYACASYIAQYGASGGQQLTPLFKKGDQFTTTIDKLHDDLYNTVNKNATLVHNRASSTDPYYIMSIDNYIAELQNRNVNTQRKVNVAAFRARSLKLNTEIIDNQLSTTIHNSLITYHSDPSNDIVEEYNRIFINILNSNLNPIQHDLDYQIYTDIWRKLYIKGGYDTAVNNFHPMVIDFLTKGTYTKPEVSVIGHVYQYSILPYLKHVYELPQKYSISENYALFDIVNILIHVTKYNICTYLNMTIRKMLTKYISSMTTLDLPGEDTQAIHNVNNVAKVSRYPEYIKSIVDAIMTTNNGATYYINEILPSFVVRYILKLPMDDTDHITDISSIIDLFHQITNIILTKSALELTKESSIIIALEQKIYPYFADIFMIYVPKLKIMIDNYVRYVHNTHNHMQIMLKVMD
jgi:ankyrin repeat protein